MEEERKKVELLPYFLIAVQPTIGNWSQVSNASKKGNN